MKKKILNPKDSWNSEFWNAGLRKELAEGENTSDVGQCLVMENERVKVWTIHLEPNKKLPFHKHSKPYFWTALSKGKSVSHYSDGSVIQTEYESNDVKYFPELNESNYFIHNLKNVGNSTLVFTTVEFLY